jgi:hypothetical protein
LSCVNKREKTARVIFNFKKITVFRKPAVFLSLGEEATNLFDELYSVTEHHRNSKPVKILF